MRMPPLIFSILMVQRGTIIMFMPWPMPGIIGEVIPWGIMPGMLMPRSEEHTSELQSLTNLVCRLLLALSASPGVLHSFPTRRSSDLQVLNRADGHLVVASAHHAHAAAHLLHLDGAAGDHHHVHALAHAGHHRGGHPLGHHAGHAHAEIGRAHV